MRNLKIYEEWQKKFPKFSWDFKDSGQDHFQPHFNNWPKTGTTLHPPMQGRALTAIEMWEYLEALEKGFVPRIAVDPDERVAEVKAIIEVKKREIRILGRRHSRRLLSDMRSRA